MEITQYQSFNEGSSSRVSMNRNSQVISKIKPKIRIIHIFAPEVIKTDVKNFRSLVQSLTGKPALGEAKTGKKRAKPRVPASHEPACGDHQQVNRLSGFSGLLANGGNQQVKEEWGSGDQSTSNTNTYFDLEGLIQDVGEDYFSSFPMRSSSTSQVEGFIYNNNNSNNFDTKGHNSS
ncbi:PREDICTED: VQ motif-containing protein 18-like [Camelina sativa]|uniref:VQ motif-containing protein 18-like n=1 Tax=Camelina sativa TaxID=90675 RepID=A0ABM0ZMZ1_CAMSA|nr:PREDICTED: VQ motif-containing protein 18-like [Camelina sativa]